MNRIKEIILISTILSSSMVIVSCLSNSTVASFEKHVDLDYKNYFTHYQISDETNDFFYIEIHRSNLTCKVTRETPQVSPSTFSKKSCDVPISGWNNINPLYSNLHVFSHDYVLLIKPYDRENHESKVHIIRMTDCHVVEISLPGMNLVRIKPPEIKGNEKFFNIFYHSTEEAISSKTDCENNICRRTYSLDGQKIEEPTGHIISISPTKFNTYNGYIPLTPYDSISTKPFYSLKMFIPKPVIYRVHSNDNATELFTSINKFPPSVSFSNSKLGLCYDYSNGSAICRQYDSYDNDKVLLNIKLNLTEYSDDYYIYWLKPYNLRDGGMVVVLVEFYEPKSLSKIKSLKIIRIRSNSQISLPVVIPYDKVDSTGLSHNQFLENDEEICFKLTSKIIEEFTHVIYRIECIPKNSFKFQM